MTSKQRLTFLGLAALIAVVAVVIIVATGGSGGSGTASGESVSTAPGPVLEQGKEQSLVAKQGETVHLQVKSADDEEVHIHGYNIEKEIPAGKTVQISFKATISGIFEIEFHHSGATIAHLTVNPS
jgi:hypothetical protein